MSMPVPPADAGQPPAAPAPPVQAQPPTPAPAQQAQPPASPPVPQPPTWTPPPPSSQGDDSEDLAKLPQKWQKHIRDLRDESAKYRTTARSETVLRHAYTTAAAHGVNPDALLGSVAFMERAKGLDPSAEDFPAKLAEAIQAALTANPWMAAAPAAPVVPPTPQVPPSSGGDFGAGNGGGQAPRSLRDQIADAESKGDWKTARQLKSALLIQQSSQ
ncbi:hypothetical protein [Planomonospora venezuelensis]|uniref:Scaffolding protein n=1 Tax=Planomonospora venezuelensis TaxID=1999 RepID=A0A841D480_PLAVE|nr:hypothetical protein [Planomonospora venezuelensis]MBB5965061.1 hypothetical protein [Planomonospora venezuelensis]GIN05022.1 hypothetical protein Pve01_66800 [Planomonospora venezuelensis]